VNRKHPCTVAATSTESPVSGLFRRHFLVQSSRVPRAKNRLYINCGGSDAVGAAGTASLAADGSGTCAIYGGETGPWSARPGLPPLGDSPTEWVMRCQALTCRDHLVRFCVCHSSKHARRAGRAGWSDQSQNGRNRMPINSNYVNLRLTVTRKGSVSY
jgi:hypothetical protein